MSTLLKGTDLSKELPIKDSKLVENDSLLMEFQEQSESEESDDGVIDPYPNFGKYYYINLLLSDQSEDWMAGAHQFSHLSAPLFI